MPTKEEFAEMAIEKLKNDTRVPVLDIELTDTKPSIFESKVGGLPYLPKDMEVPLDEDGKQMKLLAQINCKDLEPLEEYPHYGILQFWLTTEWSWEDYDVRYYRKIDETLTENDVIPRMAEFVEGETGTFPVDGEYGMEFILSEETMGFYDERVEALFCQYYSEISGKILYDPEDDGDEIYKAFDNYRCDVYNTGTKIGGYPSRTQLVDYLKYRPENYDKSLRWSKYENYVTHIDMQSDDEDFVLFQLDSDYNNSEDYKVLWYDAGIGHFKISRKDLKAGNLENVSFYWDCS